MMTPRQWPREGAALLERIKARCTMTASGCWHWGGTKNNKGYGVIGFSENKKSRPQFVHRVVAKIAYGPIPAGMIVCHHCDVRRCCNPAHLYIGTHADNSRDAVQRGRLVNVMCMQNTAKTHCPQGHEYAGRNLIFHKRNAPNVNRTYRTCRACHLIAVRKWRERKRLAIRALDLHSVAHAQQQVHL
jgi:hypothetical protein